MENRKKAMATLFVHEIPQLGKLPLQVRLHLLLLEIQLVEKASPRVIYREVE